MRKIILSLVFILATGTSFMNAKNFTIDDPVDCDSYANVTQGIVLLAGFSYEDSLIAFDNAYSACIGYNMANLVEIDEPEEIID